MCFVNIHMQNSLTKYGFVSKHFLISIFFSPSSFRMPPPPPPHSWKKNEGLFLQSCSLKCVLPIFIIYNIALQNTDFGVLHKSSKHFIISIFFPPVEGDTPPCLTSARYFVLRTIDLFFYNFVVKNVLCQYLYTT